MRLFAAVLPPAAVRDQLELFVEPRRDADRNLRWATPDTWHLTLAFFGEVPDGRLDSLVEAVDAVRDRRFGLSLAGGGALPDLSAARVLYQSVAAGAGRLSALSRRVRTAADRVAVPSDNVKHVPHLTLARTRRPAELTRWLRIVESFPEQHFEVDAFALVHSELHPSGPAHRVLHTVSLGVDPAGQR